MPTSTVGAQTPASTNCLAAAAAGSGEGEENLGVRDKGPAQATAGVPAAIGG